MVDSILSLFYIVIIYCLLYSTEVITFLVSSDGQELPTECVYFSSFQDAVETTKNMQMHGEYLNLQVASNHAKMLTNLPLDPEEVEYSKTITGANAVDLNNLKNDMETMHHYRHDTCIKLIVNELFSYLKLHQYDVCTQFKTTMSAYFSTDYLNCLRPASCTQCSGSDTCVNADQSTPCTNGERFCMTSVVQSKTNRTVIRKCADEPECRLNHIGMSDCLLVDQGPLGFAYDCHFCCIGENCNKGPLLIPPANTHYNKTL